MIDILTLRPKTKAQPKTYSGAGLFDLAPDPEPKQAELWGNIAPAKTSGIAPGINPRPGARSRR